jgi:hypothetical protein
MAVGSELRCGVRRWAAGLGFLGSWGFWGQSFDPVKLYPSRLPESKPSHREMRSFELQSTRMDEDFKRHMDILEGVFWGHSQGGGSVLVFWGQSFDPVEERRCDPICSVEERRCDPICFCAISAMTRLLPEVRSRACTETESFDPSAASKSGQRGRSFDSAQGPPVWPSLTSEKPWERSEAVDQPR